MTEKELKEFQQPPMNKSFFATTITNRDQVLDELKKIPYSEQLKTNPTAEKLLSRLHPSLQDDVSFMYKVCKSYPRGILYASQKLLDTHEAIRLVEANSNTILALPESERTASMMYKYLSTCERCDMEPHESIDCSKYFPPDQYKKHYEAALQNGRLSYIRDYDEPILTAGFLGLADRYSKNMAEEYQAIKREVLTKNVNDVAQRVTHKNDFQDYSFWLYEVRKLAPELEDQFIKQYRSDHADEFIQRINQTTKGDEFGKWLTHDIIENPDRYPTSMVQHVQNGVVQDMDINLNWQIDKYSIYAAIAEDALMHFDGLSLNEARDVVSQSTYKEIEDKLHLMPTISAAVQTFGQETNTLSPKIPTSIKELMGYQEHARLVHNAFQILKENARQNDRPEQIIDEAIVKSLHSIRNARSQCDAQHDMTSGKEPDIQADKLFLQSYLLCGEIYIDDHIINQAYQLAEPAEMEKVDGFAKFIEENKEDIAKLIIDGHVTLNDITNATISQNEINNLIEEHIHDKDLGVERVEE